MTRNHPKYTLWAGTYYHPVEKELEDPDFYKPTRFHLLIDDLETFNGEAHDLDGITHVTADITSQLEGNHVYFEKIYRCYSVVDPAFGFPVTMHFKPPPIVYDGLMIRPDVYEGEWRREACVVPMDGLLLEFAFGMGKFQMRRKY